MDRSVAIERILLGESLSEISAAKRLDLCIRAGIEADDEPNAFVSEAGEFMRVLCRELGDRHAGNSRVAAALVEWVEWCRDYEAWDSLLSSFEFDGRDRLIERGQKLFPRTMTAHWTGY